MPLTIEGAIAMLACARIGAIHSVVYAGLGHTALRDRIVDAEAKVVIVGDGFRRGKTVELKAIVDEAIDALELVEKVVVFSRRPVELASKREVNFNDLLKFPAYRQIAVAAAGQPPASLCPTRRYRLGVAPISKSFLPSLIPSCCSRS